MSVVTRRVLICDGCYYEVDLETLDEARPRGWSQLSTYDEKVEDYCLLCSKSIEKGSDL